MRRIKLVRDRIPAIIVSEGREVTYRQELDPEKRLELFKQKLREEVDEFIQDPNIEELADILEVVYQLATEIGSSPDTLEINRKKKQYDRGGFHEGIILIDYEDPKH